MDQRREDLNARIDELEGRLGQIEQRLASLEGAMRTGQLPATVFEQAETEEVSERPPAAEALPLIGRTLVVLAGAFALRALTEMGALPQTTGAALGFAYGILWIVAADRAARQGRQASAVFHGLAASIIAFPLVWEATASFGFLSPRAGAVALAVATTAGLVVAARHGLRSLAWIVAGGAAVTALPLGVATRMPALFGSLVLLLAVAGLWLGYLRKWPYLGWVLALLADGLVAVLALMVVRGDQERVAEVLAPGSVVALLLALTLLYIGSFVTRTLAWGHEVGPGEIAQGIAVLALGLGGAVVVTRSTGVSVIAVDLTSLVLAGACYAASFAVIDRHGSRGNFVFYTSVALVCTMAALVALLEGSALAIALAAAALVAGWLGSIRERATLSLHGAVYLVAAAAFGGLIGSAVDAFVGPAAPARAWIGLAVLIVIGVAVVYCGLPVASHGRTWGRFSGVPKLAVLIVLALGLGGIVVTLIAPALPAAGATPDPAALAALRTAVLSVSAVLLALGGRWPRIRETEWLVYPVLLAGGVKLVAEDVRTGRPAGLLLSFALFGCALMLVARMTRRSD